MKLPDERAKPYLEAYEDWHKKLLDLHEVVRVGPGLEGAIRTYPLTRIEDAFDDLRGGRIEGRAVVTP